MMKYPVRVYFCAAKLFLAVQALFLLAAPATADARIGERRDTVERRLFGSGGIVYRDGETKTNRSRDMPYMRYFEFLPNSADLRIYFKTADGRRPSSSELDARRMAAGWDLHVIYVNGQSAIEMYKRSQAMTDFEFNQLLSVHAGGGFWKRVSREEKEGTTSAFDFDMVRSDEKVRAKRIGRDGLIFVETALDIKLAEMNTSDQQERAPVSVEGF